jgi:TATA-binding protein-associated factor
MVAPVRETVSQTMASLLLHMPRSSILHVHRVFLDMVFQQSIPSISNELLVSNGKGSKKNGKASTHVWQVRHSGLLGMKYEVAVRNDLVDPKEEGGKDILKGVLDASLLG